LEHATLEIVEISSPVISAINDKNRIDPAKINIIGRLGR